MNNFRPFFVRMLVLMSIFCGVEFTLQASHFIGGQFSYEHLGGNNYRIVCQIWGDCCTNCTPLPTSINLYIGNQNGQSFNKFGQPSGGLTTVPQLAIQEVNTVQDDPCFTNPPPLCINVAIYRVDITLPNAPGTYTLGMKDCCRNSSIVNIPNPSSYGVTYGIDIPHDLLAVNNNSAIFLYYPPEVICLGVPFIYDHSAFDPDGDSLVYSLFTPFSDSPGDYINPTPVQWANGFNVNDQMGGSPAMAIDPQTGILTANPDSEGQYVVGIQVTEYRDGEEISVTQRDFQFNVTECEQIQVSTGTAQEEIELLNLGEYTINSCTGLFYFFEDTELGNITSNNVNYQWLGIEDIPGIYFDSTDIAISGLDPYVLFPGNGTYELQLVASIDQCTDTAYFEFNMFQLFTDFTKTDTCGAYTIDFTNTSALADIDSVHWDFGDMFADPADNESREIDASHTYSQEGTYIVKMNIYKAECSGEKIDTVIIAPPFSVAINEDDTQEICKGGIINLSASAIGGDNGNVSFAWEPVDAVTNAFGENNTANPDEDAWIILRGEMSTGCKSADSIFVTVYEYPDIQLADNAGLCEGTGTTLNAEITNNSYTNVSWSPNIEIVDETTLTPTVNPLSTTTYYISVDNEFCGSIDSIVVAPVGQVDVNVPTPDQPICEGESVELEAQSDLTVTWSGTGITDVNALTQSVTPTATTTYIVRVNNDCFEDLDSVTITVDQQPMIDAGEDVEISFNEIGQLNGTANVPITWSPPTGLMDPNDPQTIVEPDESMTYTMTAVNGQCSDQDVVNVRISANIYIQVPSAFSPNDDMVHDFLGFDADGIQTNGIESIESFTVYNRWGELVYSGSGFDAAWDGSFEEEKQPVGVYVYYIVANTVLGTELVQPGNVTLIR